MGVLFVYFYDLMVMMKVYQQVKRSGEKMTWRSKLHGVPMFSFTIINGVGICLRYKQNKKRDEIYI